MTYVQLTPGGRLHVVAGGRTRCGTRARRRGARVVTQEQFDRGELRMYVCERCRGRV